MSTDPKTSTHYTEGVCGDGAAILRDGLPMTISEILALLGDGDRQYAAMTRIMLSAGKKGENGTSGDGHALCIEIAREALS